MNDEKFLRNCSCGGSSRFLNSLTKINKIKNKIRTGEVRSGKLHKVNKKKKTIKKKQKTKTFLLFKKKKKGNQDLIFVMYNFCNLVNLVIKIMVLCI